jgi:hypothetical protein
MTPPAKSTWQTVGQLQYYNSALKCLDYCHHALILLALLPSQPLIGDMMAGNGRHSGKEHRSTRTATTKQRDNTSRAVSALLGTFGECFLFKSLSPSP